MSDNGGSAFPEVTSDQVGSNGDYHLEVYSAGGMSLRDYFAAKAMQATVGIGDRWIGYCDADYIAKLSYAMADAMLKAREKE